MEAGKLELESVPVDLSEIVDDVLSLFWDRAAAKGLDLAALIDPATPQAIEGDPVRLRQVIANLVNNAIKFTEIGGVLMEVAPVGREAIRITVQDTGIGIAQDKITSLFDAFTQADQSTTRRYGGTGLGLAISKRLVDAMGGEFRIASNPGEGSSFAFVFPTAFLEPAAAWPPPVAPNEGVLVAHSGIFTRRVLTAYFEQAGYVVTEGPKIAIAVGSPQEIRSLTSRPRTTICVGLYGDTEPQELVRDGIAQAVLTQPLRRYDLVQLLRRLQAGESLQDAADPASERSTQALPSFAGARVLVADDSAVNREVAMEALARLGVKAILVDDGRSAVETAMAERFDVVLMDGSMPWKSAALRGDARNSSTGRGERPRSSANYCPDRTCCRRGSRCMARRRHGRRSSQALHPARARRGAGPVSRCVGGDGRIPGGGSCPRREFSLSGRAIGRPPARRPIQSGGCGAVGGVRG